MTEMSKPKQVNFTLDETARLLQQTGLLFEINRAVLHPYGLALAVSIDDEKDLVTIAGLLSTEDPLGFTFSPETFEHGVEKLATFKNLKKHALSDRERTFGYVVQDKPGDGKA